METKSKNPALNLLLNALKRQGEIIQQNEFDPYEDLCEKNCEEQISEDLLSLMVAVSKERPCQCPNWKKLVQKKIINYKNDSTK